MTSFISPGVYSTEVDASQIVQSISSSIGGVVIAAEKGPRGLTLITSKKDFIDTYFKDGLPPANLGYSWACAIDFLSRGNRLWVNNVGDGSTYGITALAVAASGTHAPSFANAGDMTDVSLYDWEAHPTHQAIIYARSPGSWPVNYAVNIGQVQGSISILTINKPGYGYTVAPTLTVVPASGDTPTVTATATCTINASGEISSITITNSGAGYTKRPTVTVTPNAADMTSGVLNSSVTAAKVGVRIVTRPGFVLNVWRTPGTYTINKRTVTYTNYLLLESHLCSLEAESWNGASIYLEDVLTENSTIIYGKVSPLHNAEVVNHSIDQFTLNSGTGYVYPSNVDIIAAYEEFRNAEELDVNILINAGWTSSDVHKAMISICDPTVDSTARADCFAIIDAPSDRQLYAPHLVGYRQGTEEDDDVLGIDSSYGAIYTPDYYRMNEFDGSYFYCPPSGAVAGAMAYTDYVRDPWWAPAGLTRGKVVSAKKLRVNYDQGERETLYAAGINVLRDLKSNGVTVWGNKTLQAADYLSATSSVHVRRMLLVIEKSMANFLMYSVFEPNDEFTRLQIVSTLSSFLIEIQRSRGLYAFKVVCDETNNTPQVIDQNQMKVNVYVQPTRAAEVISLITTIMKTGASVEEYISANTLT